MAGLDPAIHESAIARKDSNYRSVVRPLRGVRSRAGTSVAKFPPRREGQSGRLRGIPERRKSTVAAWELGTKKPSAAAARLLDIVKRKGLDAIA